MSAPLPFTAPWLLAPMDGVTEPCFRDMVLARNPPEHLGGAFTEFLRVVDHTIGRRRIRAHLGPCRWPAPVGLQLMGANLDALAATAERVVEVGVPLLDLNFGCPAKGALRGCAGAALLRDPAAVEAMVSRVVAAAGAVPVTAKIRAGFEDDSQIEALARAAEAGGAALLTVHCRTSREGYCKTVRWERIARAVAAVSIPVCGNGGVQRHADLERMRAETGCRYVMVGRGALANPWLFSGRQASDPECGEFLLDYARTLKERAGWGLRGAVGQIKQLLSHWSVGDWIGPDRRSWLSERDEAQLLERISVATGLGAGGLSRGQGICGW